MKDIKELWNSPSLIYLKFTGNREEIVTMSAISIQDSLPKLSARGLGMAQGSTVLLDAQSLVSPSLIAKLIP